MKMKTHKVRTHFRAGQPITATVRGGDRRAENQRIVDFAAKLEAERRALSSRTTTAASTKAPVIPKA